MNVRHIDSSTGDESVSRRVTERSPGVAGSRIYDETVIPTTDEIVDLKVARELDEVALRMIFLEVRTANGFLGYPVRRELLVRAVKLALLGQPAPTGFRCVSFSSNPPRRKRNCARHSSPAISRRPWQRPSRRSSQPT